MNRMNLQIFYSTFSSLMVANLLPDNMDKQLLPENLNEQKLRRVLLILEVLLSAGVCSVAKFSAIRNYKEMSHRDWFWNQHLFSHSCQNHLPLFSVKFGLHISIAYGTGYQCMPMRIASAAQLSLVCLSVQSHICCWFHICYQKQQITKSGRRRIIAFKEWGKRLKKIITLWDLLEETLACLLCFHTQNPLGPQKLCPHLPSYSILSLGTVTTRAGDTMGSHWYDSTS